MTAANDPLSTPAGDQPAAQQTPPASSISIQPVPPVPATTQVMTVPKEAALTPERLQLEITRLDRCLVAVVVVLAFLLGSFLAQNSDFWMNLATGRLIAHGDYHFGSDPFAYTTAAEASPWVNHTWLYDVIVYWLSGAWSSGEPVGGGVLLVVIKALVITLVALVMLRLRRPGRSRWMPALCTGLALVVMSPRFFLQPVCLSLLFLALTLYFLERARRRGQEGRSPAAVYWPLPVLVAFWTNLDGWFLLGPIVVGLYLVGQALQQALGRNDPDQETSSRSSLAGLGLAFLACLVACLLNPCYWFGPRVNLSASAFLPPDLWAVLRNAPLKDDLWFQSLFVSPLTSEYVSNPSYGLNVTGVAYFVLLGLGLVSFVLNYAGWQWWRALVWLACALLSCLLWRTIPFFAVVAGPITALNLQDFIARRYGLVPRVESALRHWSLLGRAATLLLGLAVLVFAWSGWLNAWPNDPRRTRHVAWGVVADPSLCQAAQKLGELRAQRVLAADAQGFNYDPAIANYCAWFCPQERDFCDLRLQVFAPATMTAYADARQALEPQLSPVLAGPKGLAPAGDWSQIFRTYHINHVIINHGSRQVVSPVVQRLWFDQEQWTLLYMDGQTTIFGWKDPKDPQRRRAFQGQQFNANALAFAPNLPESERAPAKAPEPPQVPESWTDDLKQYLWHFWKGPAPHPLQVDQAHMDLLYYQGTNRQMRVYFGTYLQYLRPFLTWAGPPELVPVGAGLLDARLALTRPGIPAEYMLRGQDLAPPGAPVLAVRRARQAIAASPEDGRAYLELARAYQYLWDFQERRWAAGAGNDAQPPDSYQQAVEERVQRAGIWPSQLQAVRQVQIVTALHNALTADPQLDEAHLLLADRYIQMNYIDLAVDEWNTWLSQLRAAGPRPGETETDFDTRIDKVERFIKQQEKKYDLQRRRTNYELNARKKSLADQLRLAVNNGLAKQALDLLGENASKLDAEASALALQLLIKTGRAAEAQATSAAQQTPGGLDPGETLLIAAALGDYVQADQTLAHVAEQMAQDNTRFLLNMVRGQTLETILSPGSLADLNRIPEYLRQEADVIVLRGLLALEQGDTVAARQHFRKALAITTSPTFPKAVVAMLAGSSAVGEVALMAGGQSAGGVRGVEFPSRPIVRRYLDALAAAAR